MYIRSIARIAAAGALAASLSAMTPALAADMPGADMPGADIARGDMPPPPRLPDITPLPPRLPDPNPQAMPPIAAPVVMQVDPQTRNMWLAECRRRMDVYYSHGWDGDYGWKHHRHHESRGWGYDYCEAYFDDYYRQQAQAYEGYAARYRVAYRSQSAPAQNCVEEEHVSYEPVRSRYIPRRHDKRIPDKRIRLQGS